MDSSIVGKRVISKVDNLRFYDSASWQDKDVVGSVDEGLGFTIDAKVTVNGSSQYKVHNSKG
ncbi:N-acetylmuramoyl-L-alanine amidase family protein, partial [Paraburkholderia sp. SIMBA_053]